MEILDGKKVSNEIIENIKNTILNNNLKIKFAIIWVGNDEASSIYVNNKINKCNKVGIEAELYHLNENTTEEELISLIDKLNNRADINGILLQSPVPKHIDIINCFNRIKPEKDVDGFSNISIGNMVQGKEAITSCTPKGIIKLLDYYHIDLEGKDVCIINRSNIIGKPLLQLLLRRNATVTICHSKTKDLKKHTLASDIVICAVGKPKFLTEDMISEGTVVVDVGISRVDGKIVGDVDFENVKDKCAYISPVPGGVGPMTIAMVLENILNTAKK